MRRTLLALACCAAAVPAIGCHCVTGKCDCISDAVFTHPYASPALPPLNSDHQLPAAGSAQYGPPPAVPVGGPAMAAPGMVAPRKETLDMPKDVTDKPNGK